MQAGVTRTPGERFPHAHRGPEHDRRGVRFGAVRQGRVLLQAEADREVEEQGFVSNMVEVTVHAGTHIDTPHHFFRDRPGIEELPDAMIGEAIVLDLTFKGKANERITPADLERAERALAEQGIHLTKGATIFLRTEWPK